jgi:uncharacterized protein (DUF1697 family)
MMSRYAAMLRGINVGSHKRISMADLRRIFDSMGARNVETYVQSGNVAFDGLSGARADLAAKIRESIGADLGHDVAVVLRTHAELAAVIGTRPFGDASEERLYVTFLAETPELSRLRALTNAGFEPDEFKVRGTEVYLQVPNGYGRSKLSNEWFEKKLGVTATTRNWRTVTALAGLTRAKDKA